MSGEEAIKKVVNTISYTLETTALTSLHLNYCFVFNFSTSAVNFSATYRVNIPPLCKALTGNYNLIDTSDVGIEMKLLTNLYICST